MNGLKKVAEVVANLTVIAVGLTILVTIGYVISQHVTCVEFLQKWCVIH